MTTMNPDELVDAFAAALEAVEPELGYLSIQDDASPVGDDQRARFGIDGWIYREDLERILRRIYDAGRESAAHDVEAEAGEVEKQFPDGKTSAVLVHAARIIRGLAFGEGES